MKPSMADAVMAIYPNAVSVWVNDEVVAHDVDGNVLDIDMSIVNTKLSDLQADYDAQEYARKRAAEYPSLADFADAYYWAQNGDDTKMTAYIEKCAEIKTKYPKS